MAKKKKKGQARKLRAAAKQRLANMSGAQLVERAVARVKKGKVREGIDAYKQALKNGGDPGMVLPGLFNAYYLRCRELESKKMTGEAKVVRDMGASVIEQIPEVGADVLGTAASFLLTGDVINLYCNYLSHKAPVYEVEKKIGSRLIVENCLGLADKFDDGSLFCQDAPIVSHALDAMNAGRWDQAFRQMRGVSRKSPYADIKAFTKAMTAFGRGDKVSLEKALGGIDQDFPLKSAVAVLNAWAKDEVVDPTGKNRQSAGLMMGESVKKHGYRKNLENAVRKKDIKGTIKWIKALAGLLGFKSRKTGITGILEIIGAGRSENGMSMDNFSRIVKGSLGSTKHMEVVFQKVRSRDEGFLSFATPDYLKALGWEFPDVNDRKSALAVILTELILVLKHTQKLFWDREEELDDILDFLDAPIDVIEEGEEEDVLFFLARKAADADPENKEARDAILGMPEHTPAMRKALVPSLEAMMATHENDHRPCLKLARLFYKKNAYRKAATVLAQAYERAPHDLGVKDEYALSFLVAAAGNLKRGKIDLAERDLDKAATFKAQGLKLFVAEKRVVAFAARGNGFSRDWFDQQTQEFAPHEKMAVLLLFKVDAQDSGFIPPLNTRGVDTVFKILKKQMGRLDSQQTLSLVTPLANTRAVLYEKAFFAGPLMGKRGQLLDALGDDTLINIMVDLVENGCRDQVIRQLAKRKKKKNAPLKSVLDFCHAAFEYMDGIPSAVGILGAIADQADDRLKAQLRKISRDFARICSGYVAHSFSSFDFRSRMGWRYPVDDDWDEWNEWDDEWDDEWDEGGDDWDDEWDPGLGGGITEELKELVDRFMKEMGKGPKGNFPFQKIHEEINELLQQDTDPFDPGKIFGKGRSSKKLITACEAVTKTAVGIVDGDQGMRGHLQVDLNRFMLAVEGLGFTSTGEYREAGRKFALGHAPAKAIVMAMDICSVSVDGMNAMHFIMGMRTGI